jgi:hypothetical protein
VKYLGVNFIAGSRLIVDTLRIKRRFYAALNSVLPRCAIVDEPVKVAFG